MVKYFMNSDDQKFSSFLPIEVFIHQNENKSKDWKKLDIGPGIFHIPENHSVMIRVHNIDDNFLKQLVLEIKGIEYITALNLSENRKITDNGLVELLPLMQLQDLNLSSCDVSDKGLLSLIKLNKLQRLNISFCNRITDIGIKSLKNLPDLEYLDLQGLPKITNGSLSKMRKSSLMIHR
jgi:Leucine-rich repeat (LRR) protein